MRNGDARFNNDNRFDVDLKFGELAETELVKVLCAETLEVKCDRMAHKTGNIAVEFESRGKLSGIMTTQATHWAFVLEHLTLLVETRKLKELVNVPNARIVSGGDNMTSQMVLVPLAEIIKYGK